VSIAWLERESEPHGRFQLSIITARYGGIGKSDDRRRFSSSLTGRAPRSGRTDDRHERRSDDRQSHGEFERGGRMGMLVIHGLWKKLSSNRAGAFHHHHTINTAVGTIPNSAEADRTQVQVEHAKTF
jgi:hypothetical protein